MFYFNGAYLTVFLDKEKSSQNDAYKHKLDATHKLITFDSAERQTP